MEIAVFYEIPIAEEYTKSAIRRINYLTAGIILLFVIAITINPPPDFDYGATIFSLILTSFILYGTSKYLQNSMNNKYGLLFTAGGVILNFGAATRFLEIDLSKNEMLELDSSHKKHWLLSNSSTGKQLRLYKSAFPELEDVLPGKTPYFQPDVVKQRDE